MSGEQQLEPAMRLEAAYLAGEPTSPPTPWQPIETAPVDVDVLLCLPADGQMRLFHRYAVGSRMGLPDGPSLWADWPWMEPPKLWARIDPPYLVPLPSPPATQDPADG